MDNSMWSSKMDGRQHIGSHAPSHVEIHVQVQGTDFPRGVIKA